jgi:hypothetical protein
MMHINPTWHMDEKKIITSTRKMITGQGSAKHVKVMTKEIGKAGATARSDKGRRYG